ncbi:MAG TPA: glycosyltransferase family 39 protein [Acidimicrobiales bacterium]
MRARWVRPVLIALLALTALAYLWDLSASGNANSFYAAAVQAGTKSWKAFFFGSIDSSNFITVDKPPASLWVMELSGRVFGFSSWSMLAPQALEGVTAVGILYATVRRWFGAPAGLLAGAALAVTPVAALMFRFNNPDALLVLMLVASAYTLVRALEQGRWKWVAATGALLGFAFLAKMLQAFSVLPAFFVVYLIAAPISLRRRLVQLAVGGAAIIVSAGWWVAAVALWPTADRPLIDGSPTNSIINLILGYNGFGRIVSGNGGGGGGGNFSGAAGIFRLFNTLMGGQASWLIPAALLALVGGLVWRRRAPRTDRTRAALMLWGGWLIVTGAVFSFGQGVIHTYYTVALAPAIAALFAIGAVIVWRRRDQLSARLLGGVGMLGSAIWAYVLLDRSPSYYPWLRIVVLIAGVLATIAVVGAPIAGRFGRRAVVAGVAVGLVACLAAPMAFTATTVTSAETGSIPSAGPAVTGGSGLGGGPGGAGGFGGGTGPGVGSAGAPSGSRPTGSGTQPTGAGRRNVAGTGSPGAFGTGPSGAAGARAAGGRAAGARAAGAGAAGAGAGGGRTTSAALVAALKANATSYRWAAATFGSQSAAMLELASGGVPVMAIGGFNGQGGNISLATFQSYVAKGDIHYFIASGGGAGGGPGGGGGNSEAAITAWVKSHYTATTIGGVTAYNLTAAK